MKKPKILLLSGYDAPSHQYWRESLVNSLSEFEWTQVALPARHFSWRIRGNAFNFFNQHKTLLEKDYDLLIVTSMVDLNNLRGLIPNLARLPTIVYFHENQFAYPQSNASENEQQNLLNAQITSLFSAYSADRILFNSHFNLQSFFQGATSLVKRLPDGIGKQDLSNIKNKSAVLPVPIQSDVHGRSKLVNNEAIKILWNHRWEFDKQPQVFIQAMRLIKKKGLDFELYILGQSFRQKPDCFNDVSIEFKNELKLFGYQSRAKYDETMQQVDIVISSALHDFQGLSMLEAIFSGCVAIAPNRVAYPEYIDADFLYQVPSYKEPSFDGLNHKENRKKLSLTKDQIEQLEAISLSDKIVEILNKPSFKKKRAELVSNNQLKISNYSDKHLIPLYKHEILKLIN